MKSINFNGMGISENILKSLSEMGISEATPVQSQAIEMVMQKHDLVVQAPTGTGKTFAFGIPILELTDTKNRNIQSLVLCPTRELAIQTTAALQKLASFRNEVKITAIYGGENIERQMMALRRNPQIIVVTPGRLIDHLNRKTIKLNDLKMLVLDEADSMLDLGFREELDVILETITCEHQTVLFSATMSPDIMRIAKTYQNDAKFIHIKQETLTVDGVKHYYAEVKGKTKTPALFKLLNMPDINRVLVFVATKLMADELSEEMEESGFKSAVLHGDLRQQQRDRVMDKFRRGKVDVLVATDVAARGIDVSDIDTVINYDIPQYVDSYVHRIGRTGRAMKTGVAYTLIYNKQRKKLKEIMMETKTIIRPISIDLDSDSLEDAVTLKASKKESFKELFKESRKESLRESYKESFRDSKKEFKKDPKKDSKKESKREYDRKSDIEDTSMVHMSISIGELDNISPRDVISLICENTALRSKEIGKILINDENTIFDIQSKHVNQVMEDFQGIKFNKQKLVVEVSGGRYSGSYAR